MSSPKKLILNADDYGSCRQVNLAVEQVAKTGILGGVSVLANGECWEGAVAFLRNKPDLGAGVHLNVVEGQPVSAAPEVGILTGRDGSFLGLRILLSQWLLRPIAVSRAVEIEWRAQIERVMRAGLRLKHLDSHQHSHAYPFGYRCAVALCQDYGIPAIRHPGEVNARPMRRMGTLALRTSLAISRIVAGRAGLRYNNQFLGFKRAGAYGITELIEDLRYIPNGLTEIALHPSVEDGVPYPNLSGSRELRALLDDSLPDRIKQLGIELTTWSRVTQ
jgi:predicted glycoside hydrolase/deacetylase ChbG (UPF0249 family)